MISQPILAFNIIIWGKHNPMQDTLIKALPVETPITLPKPSKITQSYTYTSFHTSSTVSGLNRLTQKPFCSLQSRGEMFKSMPQSNQTTPETGKTHRNYMLQEYFKDHNLLFTQQTHLEHSFFLKVQKRIKCAEIYNIGVKNSLSYLTIYARYNSPCDL